MEFSSRKNPRQLRAWKTTPLTLTPVSSNLHSSYLCRFGEFGPGNNLGLLASKSVAPTAVRGTIYGGIAAIGEHEIQGDSCLTLETPFILKSFLSFCSHC